MRDSQVDTGPALDIGVIRNPAAFRDLRDEWRDLYARAYQPNVFRSFEWLWNAWECVAGPKGRQLNIIVGWISGRVVLVWPLVSYGPKLMRLLASDRGEYRDVVVESGPYCEAWTAAAYRALRETGDFDFLYLQDIPDHSMIKRVLDKAPGRVRVHVRRAPYIDLKPYTNFGAYFQSLRKGLRQNQSRQIRKLSALGDVRYVVTEDRASAEEIIGWTYQTKLKWQDQRQLTSASFRSEEYARFLRAATLDAFADGHAHFSKLMVGDVIAAAGIGFHDDREFAYYMFSYNEDLDRYSPGRILMGMTIEWIKDNGIAYCDFMAATQGFKYRWTDQERYVANFLIPCTGLGILIVAWYTSAIRRAFLKWINDNAFRRRLGRPPKPVRRALEAVLLVPWGDPFQDS